MILLENTCIHEFQIESDRADEEDNPSPGGDGWFSADPRSSPISSQSLPGQVGLRPQDKVPLDKEFRHLSR